MYLHILLKGLKLIFIIWLSDLLGLTEKVNGNWEIQTVIYGVKLVI